MTPNRFSDTLFQLIKSLEKGEKRHFKLYVNRNASGTDLKVVELFDALDKLESYDEKLLLKRLKTIQKPQLANVKNHLYKQLLESLRLLKSNDSLDLQISEQLDYAHILYKKGLFNHAEKILEKVKELARTNHKVIQVHQALALEKRLETLHITRNKTSRAMEIAQETNELLEHMNNLAKLSNMVILIQNWFINHSFCRTKEDLIAFDSFLLLHMPKVRLERLEFYEQMYWLQTQSMISFIKQNYLQHYKQAQRLVHLFATEPMMKRVETGNYIKALHSLLNVLFYLRYDTAFAKVLGEFEEFGRTDRVQLHDNFRLQVYVYLTSAKLNLALLTGTFDAGIKLVENIEKTISEDSLFIDDHRIKILRYKIAILYFGAGNHSKSIDYLQQVIQVNSLVSSELQCYARLVHLIAHYELGNYSLVEYLTKSVYRYMSKMKYLSKVETAMFRFLKKSLQIPRHKLRAEQEALLEQIKILEKQPSEARSFTYLDISSWLESKLQRTTFSIILNEKIKASKSRKYMG